MYTCEGKLVIGSKLFLRIFMFFPLFCFLPFGVLSRHLPWEISVVFTIYNFHMFVELYYRFMNMYVVLITEKSVFVGARRAGSEYHYIGPRILLQAYDNHDGR